MKKLAILLAACLLLLCFAACNSDDEEDYTITPTVFPEGVVPIDFDENGEAVLWASDAYAYDEPIILENDDMNFGGWVVENSPAAYWCVNVPEDGDYNLQIMYSRADEGEVEGWWEQEVEGLGSGFRITFESTGDWATYTDYTTTMNLDAGTSMLTLRADDEDTGGYFINLESIILTPYVEEETVGEEYDVLEPDGEAPVEDEYVEEEPFAGGLADDGPFDLSYGMYSLITEDDVYYRHDSSNTNFQFRDDGTAQYNGESGIMIYDYAVDGNLLTLTYEDETITMEILDPCNLVDTSDNTTYAIPDSEGTELEVFGYYWRNGDVFAGSLFFHDDGTVSVEGEEGPAVEGTYTQDGDVITVEAEGGSMTLTILNRRVLQTEGSDRFLLLGEGL